MEKQNQGPPPRCRWPGSWCDHPSCLRQHASTLLGALAVPVAKYSDATLDSQECSQGHSERATLPKASPPPRTH